MRPCDCYRFESCNASVCPLEPEIGHYLHGEALCLIARRLASGRGKDDELHRAVAEGVPRVCARFGEIARELRRADEKLARRRAQYASGPGQSRLEQSRDPQDPGSLLAEMAARASSPGAGFGGRRQPEAGSGGGREGQTLLSGEAAQGPVPGPEPGR